MAIMSNNIQFILGPEAFPINLVQLWWLLLFLLVGSELYKCSFQHLWLQNPQREECSLRFLWYGRFLCLSISRSFG